ncbi:MAG: type II toxin-antitoxin system Phd/YefM family antitoxin [Deltaproteobacteria bacterium]|nr:type II toxin-antitoxin system Phd/YefM family antitoxin [Deltaproteobacteria bacterium]
MIEYSISQAKNDLPKIVHEAERQGVVRLHRRGRPVAVILSEEEYRRLLREGGGERSLFDSISEWRREAGDDLPDVGSGEVDAWRDRTPGRTFAWPT